MLKFKYLKIFINYLSYDILNIKILIYHYNIQINCD